MCVKVVSGGVGGGHKLIIDKITRVAMSRKQTNELSDCVHNLLSLVRNNKTLDTSTSIRWLTTLLRRLYNTKLTDEWRNEKNVCFTDCSTP